VIRRTHVVALLALASLAVVHTWPLAARLNDVIPGAGLGDNVSSLWSVWWMREALARADVSFFHTAYQFAPFGTPLVLHTHLAPAALVGATLLAGVSVPAALNLILLAAVFLNGATAYGLAFHVTRRALPALLAGVLFMLAPPLLARLQGHFNLVQAWTLVLALWMWVRVAAGGPPEGGHYVRALAAGAALALTAWTDYYLFIYALAVIATLCAAERWRAGVTRQPPVNSTAAIACAVGAMIGLAVAVAIIVRGSGAVSVLGATISLRSAGNPLMVMWVLAIAAAVLRWRLRLRIERRQDAPALWPRPLTVALATCLVLIAPLIWMGAELVLDGGYATQRLAWRTAPGGVDLATLVAGPPFHPILGDAVRGLYARIGIDAMESSAWLGISACVLALRAVRMRPLDKAARLWTTAGVVFFVWALGPFLTVAGANTWLILPQQFVRYVPVVGNARMPARALIVVSLAMAVLAACWAARRSSRVVVLAAILACAELTGAPLAVARLDVPAVYRALAREPGGLVLELPFGLEDGFGEIGDFDQRTLVYQTVHGHPMTGGFAARLSPVVRRQYEDHPVLGALLRLSERRVQTDPPYVGDADAPPCAQAMSTLAASGFRFLVIDRNRMPPALAAYIADWPLVPLAASGGRELFRLEHACPPNQRGGP
jgi:hypothetical protein